MAKWRRHSVEFKKQAVDRMRQCDNIEALARELQIERKLLYTWKWQSAGRAEARHADLSEIAERKLREENQRLKEALADKVLELDFFQRRLSQDQGRRPGSVFEKPWQIGYYAVRYYVERNNDVRSARIA